jgi:adenylate kinase
MDCLLLFLVCWACRKHLKFKNRAVDLLVGLAQCFYFVLFGIQIYTMLGAMQLPSFPTTAIDNAPTSNASGQASSQSNFNSQALPNANRHIVVLFGPPGAGKGSQAPGIVKRLSVVQLSTGDMLRAAVAEKTEVGLQAEALMQAGALVPDSVVVNIIRDRISQPDCDNGFVLDGFPRTLDQAHALDVMLAEYGESVRVVISLNTPDEVLEERICGRWVHKESGRSYHVKFKPPNSVAVNNTMCDDITGEKLMQRPDDTKSALHNRLQKYHQMSTPILAHYSEMGIVDEVKGDQKMSEISADIHGILSKRMFSTTSASTCGSAPSPAAENKGSGSRSLTFSINVDSLLFHTIMYAGSLILIYAVIKSSTSTSKPIRAEVVIDTSTKAEKVERLLAEAKKLNLTVSGAQGEALVRELKHCRPPTPSPSHHGPSEPVSPLTAAKRRRKSLTILNGSFWEDPAVAPAAAAVPSVTSSSASPISILNSAFFEDPSLATQTRPSLSTPAKPSALSSPGTPATNLHVSGANEDGGFKVSLPALSPDNVYGKQRSLTDALVHAADREPGRHCISCLRHDDLERCVIELSKELGIDSNPAYPVDLDMDSTIVDLKQQLKAENAVLGSKTSGVVLKKSASMELLNSFTVSGASGFHLTKELIRQLQLEEM